MATQHKIYINRNDSSYLGYEAGEKIDWVWEHRIEDFSKAGV